MQLISNLGPWLNRKHGEVVYNLSVFLAQDSRGTIFRLCVLQWTVFFPSTSEVKFASIVVQTQEGSLWRTLSDIPWKALIVEAMLRITLGFFFWLWKDRMAEGYFKQKFLLFPPIERRNSLTWKGAGALVWSNVSNGFTLVLWWWGCVESSDLWRVFNTQVVNVITHPVQNNSAKTTSQKFVKYSEVASGNLLLFSMLWNLSIKATAVHSFALDMQHFTRLDTVLALRTLSYLNAQTFNNFCH